MSDIRFLLFPHFISEDFKTRFVLIVHGQTKGRIHFKFDTYVFFFLPVTFIFQFSANADCSFQNTLSSTNVGVSFEERRLAEARESQGGFRIRGEVGQGGAYNSGVPLGTVGFPAVQTSLSLW